MNRLIRADLIFREEDRENDLYRFKHAITQEVAYEMLPRQRASPVQARPHRAQRTAQKSRDLGVGQPVEVMKRHDLLIPGWEGVDHGAERGADLTGKQLPLRIGRLVGRSNGGIKTFKTACCEHIE